MSVYTNNTLNKQNSNEAWSKIFNFIEPNTLILDVGCSSGRLGAELKKQKDVHIVGIDIDKADVELAKKNLDDAHVLDVETDDLSSLGKFDFIIIADVIEHLLNPVQALKKVRTLLKPGGKLVFSVPNMANGIVRLELLKGRFEYADWGLLDRTHLHYYDQEEVRRTLSEAGFKVQKMDCNVKDIPTNILKEHLLAIGLKPTEKFIKHMHSPEVVVYQFIGCAQVSTTKSGLKIQSKTPFDFIDKEMSDINKEVADLQIQLKQKENELTETKSELNQSTERLDAILNSKGWKVLEKTYTARHKLKAR